MFASIAESRPERKRGVSITLVALLAFGAFQIGFLALHAIFDFQQRVLVIEASLAVFVTVACLAIVALEDRRSDRANETTERQLSHLADFATDLFWETDLEGIVITAGGRMMSKIVPDPDEVLGQHYLDIINLEDREKQKMLDALSAIKPYSDILSVLRDPEGKAYHVSLSATPRLNRAGDVIGYLGVGTNVTRRIQDQSRLKYMAEHDMLTGLANRYAFQTRIEENIGESGEDENVGLLVIDLDNFKAINDTLGHHTGDALLSQVAKRIRETIRTKDWAARLGGDEFVIVCRDVPNPMDACLMASRLVTALSRPFEIAGQEVVCSASVGVACAPLHARDSSTLMKYADLALYDAKASGRSCYRLYETPPSAQRFVN